MYENRQVKDEALAMVGARMSPVAAASGKSLAELYEENDFYPVLFRHDPVESHVTAGQLAEAVVQNMFLPDAGTGQKKKGYGIMKPLVLGSMIVGAALMGFGAHDADAKKPLSQKEMYAKAVDIMNLAQKTPNPYKSMAADGKGMYQDVNSFVPSYMLDDLFPSNSTAAKQGPYLKGENWKNFVGAADLAKAGTLDRLNATQMYLAAELEEGRGNATMDRILHPALYGK